MFLYSAELAAAKRADPGDDIISALLQAEVDGEKLTDTEFNLFFQLLAVAGNETTRNLISHGMHLLIENPDQRAKLLADRSLLPGTVDEMLRYASPVMYMRRTAQSDFELRGQTIKRGRQDRALVHRGEPRRGGVRRRPTRSTSPGRRTTTSPSVAVGRTSASAPTWPSSRSG